MLKFDYSLRKGSSQILRTIKSRKLGAYQLQNYVCFLEKRVTKPTAGYGFLPTA